MDSLSNMGCQESDAFNLALGKGWSFWVGLSHGWGLLYSNLESSHCEVGQLREIPERRQIPEVVAGLGGLLQQGAGERA